MPGKGQEDVLAQGYAWLKDECGRRELAPGRVARFGLQPGWNAVIGTYAGASLFDMARDFTGNDLIRERSVEIRRRRRRAG